MKELDELLKENLLPDCVPEKSLNASIVKKAKETQNMKHRTLKSGVAAQLQLESLLLDLHRHMRHTDILHLHRWRIR